MRERDPAAWGAIGFSAPRRFALPITLCQSLKVQAQYETNPDLGKGSVCIRVFICLYILKYIYIYTCIYIYICFVLFPFLNQTPVGVAGILGAHLRFSGELNKKEWAAWAP